MKTLATVVLATTLTALVGCVRSMGPSDMPPLVVDDPPLCPAEIQVNYGQGGMPAVGTPACSVLQNQFVTWSGPPGNPTVFGIKFKAAAVVWDYERGEAMSMADGTNQKVKRKMIGAPGTYQYAVKANGKVLDPAIIIRAQ